MKTASQIDRLQLAINDLKDSKSPLFGGKLGSKSKLKQRIKKNKNFESISLLKRKRRLNSSFRGIKALALKSGISADSDQFKALLAKGTSRPFGRLSGTNFRKGLQSQA